MSPDFNVQRFFYSGYIQNFGGAVWEEGKRLNVEITRSLLMLKDSIFKSKIAFNAAN